MNHANLLKVILAPHTSEKAVVGTEKHDSYVFRVASSATKPTVKEAIEALFKVKVDQVRIVNVKTKPKRFGSIQGRSKAWKKAYVTLSSGQQIDLAGNQA